MLSDIGGSIKFAQDLTLAEQHIYGSARHGMYTPDRLLARFHFSITDTLQIAMDSFKFVQSTTRFMRIVTYKQYELSNHLGNVLTTVYDRRTPIEIGGGNHTIKYFEADVIFATDYYPRPYRKGTFGQAFGSGENFTKTVGSKAGRYYSYTAYRYGFNNQEKDGEMGEYYSFEYRVHDARLGRFLSVDPLVEKYPFYSPYQFCSNSTIMSVELEGMETDQLVNAPEINFNSGASKYNWSNSNVEENSASIVPNSNNSHVFLNASSTTTCPVSQSSSDVKIVPPKVIVSDFFLKLFNTTMETDEARSRFYTNYGNCCAIKMSLILQEQGGFDFSIFAGQFGGIGGELDITQKSGDSKNGTIGLIVIKGAPRLIQQIPNLKDPNDLIGNPETYKNDPVGTVNGKTAREKFNEACSTRSGIVFFDWSDMQHIDLWYPKYTFDNTLGTYKFMEYQSIRYSNWAAVSHTIIFIPIH